MAFDPVAAANNAADNLQALPGTPVTDRAKLVAYLTAIFQGMYTEQLANAVILPGTFTTPSGNVTGDGKYT